MPARTSPTTASKPLTGAALRRMSKRSYMNERQRTFFRNRLLEMMHETQEGLDQSRLALQSAAPEPDESDLASLEEDRRYILRAIERNAGMVDKIRAALRRLDSGEYGYCLETGEPIGIERLLARPTAEYAIDTKIRQETLEKHYRHARRG